MYGLLTREIELSDLTNTENTVISLSKLSRNFDGSTTSNAYGPVNATAMSSGIASGGGAGPGGPAPYGSVPYGGNPYGESITRINKILESIRIDSPHIYKALIEGYQICFNKGIQDERNL
jgi:hypothetical protein